MPEDRLQELRACLALRHSPGIGPHTWRGLLEHYGSAREAVAEARAWRRLGLVRADAIQPFLAGAWEAGAARELERALALADAEVLAWADPDYPPLLRAIPDPPILLYCRGDLRLLRGPAVAIVGSRKYVPEGMLAASRIGRGLSAAGVTVVSGMAWGIDREAHLAGLTGPGSSVAVLGTGLDRVYPSRNVDVFKRLGAQGLLVTEFAPGTGPEAGNFPVRNRIVSGLALGVVVAQAAARSGSRITARLALEQGREVYVFPGPRERRISRAAACWPRRAPCPSPGPKPSWPTWPRACVWPWSGATPRRAPRRAARGTCPWRGVPHAPGRRPRRCVRCRRGRRAARRQSGRSLRLHTARTARPGSGGRPAQGRAPASCACPFRRPCAARAAGGRRPARRGPGPGRRQAPAYRHPGP
jgi:DNA protecting protein DprA